MKNKTKSFFINQTDSTIIHESKSLFIMLTSHTFDSQADFSLLKKNTWNGTYRKHIFVKTSNIRQKRIQRKTQWLSDPSWHAHDFLRIKMKELHKEKGKLGLLKTKCSSNF